MKRWGTLLLLFAFVVPVLAQEPARGGRGDRVQWGIDLGFQYYFDNGEFDASQSKRVTSGTVHAAVLTPVVSARVHRGAATHSLNLGADLQHDMGSQTWSDAFREGLLYYDGRVRTENGVFEGVAGIYPRRLMRAYYSEAFFSDRNRFLDRNFEGVLLKWRGSRFYTEAALDWLGERGYDRKERFQVISAGAWQLARVLSLGWAADYYHYAGSELAPGVVDHGLLHPWLKLDLAPGTPWQELSLRGGALLSYQWDREREASPSTPGGAEFDVVLRRWNLTLENNLYLGGDLLPLYDGVDLAGHPYGDNLYFGHRLYTGFYDRAELRWTPVTGRFVHFQLGIRAHFSADGIEGWQQVASLRFDLVSHGERRR